MAKLQHCPLDSGGWFMNPRSGIMTKGPCGEMVNTADLKSVDREVMGVQVPPRAPLRTMFFLAGLLFLAGWARAGGAAFLEPQGCTLKNGMQVVVIGNHRSPVVCHSVWYKVGSADEDPSRPLGLAHFCEHMMFRGTKANPGQAFKDAMQRMGAEHNAFTSHDCTAYHQMAGVEHLETLMALEADRMLNLQVNLDDVATESKVVAEERRMRYENRHASQLDEKAWSCLFAHHPYRFPVIGWAEDIRQYTPGLVRMFYKKWYQPANAILVVAGDVTLDQVRTLAEKHYGCLPSAPPCRRKRLVEPPSHAASVRLVKTTDQTRLPDLALYWRTPAVTSKETLKTAAALQVVCRVVGQGRTSRLYRALVEQHKLASTVGMNYHELRDAGVVELSVSPVAGVSAEALEKAVDEVLGDLARNPVTAAELASVRARLLGELDYVRDSLEKSVITVGLTLAADLGLDVLESWPEAIGRVSLADVAEASRILVNRTERVVAVLEPAGGDAPDQAIKSARKDQKQASKKKGKAA